MQKIAFSICSIIFIGIAFGYVIIAVSTIPQPKQTANGYVTPTIQYTGKWAYVELDTRNWGYFPQVFTELESKGYEYKFTLCHFGATSNDLVSVLIFEKEG